MIVHENLLKGRRNLDKFPQLSILKDWTWVEDLERWSLRFSLCIELNVLERKTYWVALVTDNYPHGDLSIYPDYELGMMETFPHQLNNDLNCFYPFFKSGKICLDRPSDKFTNESLDEFEKLAWYVDRLFQWICSADNNSLLKNGDYFEIPDIKTIFNKILIYDEDYFSVEVRNSNEARFGFVDIALFNDTFIVKKFSDCSGHIVHKISWGKQIQDIANSNENQVGGWILLKKPIVVNRWQSPNTYEQLKEAFKCQGENFKTIFSQISSKLRDQKQHLLLLGYPAPLIIGNEPDSIIWQTIQLPTLSSGNIIPAGFRKNETGWLQQDLTKKLFGKAMISWIRSENWNSTNILTRGSITSDLCRMRVLIIGAGSLGSMIAEMLVRSGVVSITMIDDDIFEVGNLSRHILDIDSIGLNKAKEVAKKLNKVNPHARVQSINKKFDECFANQIMNFDVIFDCSGENEILEILSETNTSQWFCSASFSFEVNNLYVFVGKIEDFSYDDYFERFSRTIENETTKYDLDKLPWEGIGCWSPVFPATYGDVSLAASTIVSVFDQRFKNNETSGDYLLYQKQFDSNGMCIGVIQVDTKI